MEAQYAFKATENQYKKQFKKWKIDHKRLKGAEFKAIVRKKRERERGNPAKNTEFRLRGEKVEGSKIIRYQKR
ncbi:MAG: hypothetical protein ALECFALPRED_004949 [Alectoria fallacina]|uniref:Clr5 domain-containing protein n=1 Tax=Alectoria fallacina TaxID=1903189 RepID=A0A8H3FUX8_9LECA|nr:MAG: hypothetical protein ALECFALPRED_004949 [Alectoria fallacina]